MRDCLVLYINGRRHEVRGRDALLSLSDFLRRRLRLIGTKIVCSEGDCGACTVLVGRPASNPIPHSPLPIPFSYRPVDSCIQFMFQLDGTHVVTVEGLRPPGELNGVQQALVDGHGSQCGFCTPGFAMAMTGLLEECDALDEPCLRGGLTGNLCRCTGYTQIIEAGVAASAAEHERLNELYPASPMLRDFEELSESPIEIHAESFGEMHLISCPATLDGALTFLAAHPTAIIVAGATDVGVRANKSQRLPAAILDLNRIVELESVMIAGGELRAGARASWTTLLAELTDSVPEFARIIAVFGAPQIRHVGTIGGNIANASPIADSLPFLLVMDATLELASATGRRVVNINDFYRGYKQIDLRPGELIAQVRIPLPEADDLLRLYKVSRRRDLDIAGFTAAIRLRLDGETIAAASVALGAVGPTVLRPRRTEEFLVDRELSEATMRAAGELAVEEITPIDDVRGAAEYRRQLTRNVFLKFYHQTQADLAPA